MLTETETTLNEEVYVCETLWNRYNEGDETT